MLILFSDEELQLLTALEAAEVDPVTIIVHLFTKFGANYDRMPEPVNQEIKDTEDPELADEFAGALIVPDGAVQMKREVSEVE